MTEEPLFWNGLPFMGKFNDPCSVELVGYQCLRERMAAFWSRKEAWVVAHQICAFDDSCDAVGVLTDCLQPSVQQPDEAFLNCLAKNFGNFCRMVQKTI
jgi:hypothetical protein